MKDLGPLYAGRYLAHIRNALPLPVAERVSFTGNVAHGRVVGQYRDADVFVFPSVWEEPSDRKRSGEPLPGGGGAAAEVPADLRAAGRQDSGAGASKEYGDPRFLALSLLPHRLGHRRSYIPRRQFSG